MTPPHQPGLFFWQVRNLPKTTMRALRRAGWQLREMMSVAHTPGLLLWHVKRAPSRLWSFLVHPSRWRFPSFKPAPPAFDRPSFAHALQRLHRHDLAIRSIVNIGAGSGQDSAVVQSMWPEARTLLVEMDAAFEPGYRELQRELPNLSWDICAAGPEDGIGRMQKSDLGGGVGGALDLEGASDIGADVQIKRIDTLVREHALEPPYFLRFDTHGFELDILKGATETLRQTALIMMECYNFKLAFTGDRNLTFDEMSLHMKSLGFRCVDMCDPLYRPGDRALWQMHLFFIRADHPLWSNASYSRPRDES
jgi:FkbM family methyltransferase